MSTIIELITLSYGKNKLRKYFKSFFWNEYEESKTDDLSFLFCILEVVQ